MHIARHGQGRRAQAGARRCVITDVGSAHRDGESMLAADTCLGETRAALGVRRLGAPHGAGGTFTTAGSRIQGRPGWPRDVLQMSNGVSRRPYGRAREVGSAGRSAAASRSTSAMPSVGTTPTSLTIRPKRYEPRCWPPPNRAGGSLSPAWSVRPSARFWGSGREMGGSAGNLTN